MEALENLLTRRSIRDFDENRMPDSKTIELIAKAGTYAPCSRGRQSGRIIVITNKEVRDRLSKLNAYYFGVDSDPFYNAPVVFAVLVDRSINNHMYDGPLIMGNLLNAAHALGLGSCWIHRAKEIFDSDEGKQMLKDWGVHGDYEGIGFCVVGYSSKDVPLAKPRKDDFVVYVK